MSEQISEELFDEFRTSIWPERFSALAQEASRRNVDVEDVESFWPLEYHLSTMASGLQRSMLEEMGIVKNHPEGRVKVTPSMVQDGFHGTPDTTLIPKFTDLGKEVIMACENLFTPEEHEAANEGKEAELAEIIQAGDAEFGVVR